MFISFQLSIPAHCYTEQYYPTLQISLSLTPSKECDKQKTFSALLAKRTET